MKIHILIIVLLLTFGAQAQHNLVMTRPVEFNGGLAGNAGYDRLSFNTHSMGDNVSLNDLKTHNVVLNSYKGYNSSLSYDWLSTKLKGGIDISVKHRSFSYENINNQFIETVDTLDNGYTYHTESYYLKEKTDVSNTSIGITYSPKFIIKQKIAFSPFINLNTYYGVLENSAIRIDNNEEHPAIYHLSPINEIGINTTIGFLFNKGNWFAGYKMLGLQTGMKNGVKDLIHVAQYGRLFNFKKDSKIGIGFILSLVIPVISNDKSSIYGANEVFAPYLKLSNLTLGVQWGGFYGLGVFANYKYKNYSFGYSINLKETKYGGNRHEIGLQYVFKRDKEKDKLFSVPLKN